MTPDCRMTTQDIRDLLAEIAQHDGRVIDDVAVYAWGEQARRGGWDRETAIDAVRAFYAWTAEVPVRWLGGERDGEPRPVLPYDIHTFTQMRRLMQEPA